MHQAAPDRTLLGKITAAPASQLTEPARPAAVRARANTPLVRAAPRPPASVVIATCARAGTCCQLRRQVHRPPHRLRCICKATRLSVLVGLGLSHARVAPSQSFTSGGRTDLLNEDAASQSTDHVGLVTGIAVERLLHGPPHSCQQRAPGAPTPRRYYRKPNVLSVLECSLSSVADRFTPTSVLARVRRAPSRPRRAVAGSHLCRSRRQRLSGRAHTPSMFLDVKEARAAVHHGAAAGCTHPRELELLEAPPLAPAASALAHYRALRATPRRPRAC